MTKQSTAVDSRRGSGQILLWIIAVVLSLVILAPLIQTASTLFPFIVGKAIFARSIIEIAFALWLILIIRYPQHRPTKSWVLISLAIWLSVSVIAGFTGVSFTRSLWSTFARMNGVFDQAHWVVFILVTGSVYRTLSSWRILLTLNLGIASLVSIIGLRQYYDSSEFLGTEYLKSTIGNSSFMGAYVMVNAILGLGLILQSLGRHQTNPTPHQYTNRTAALYPLLWLRIFWLLATFLCLWSLWLTASRGAVFSFGVGALTLVIGYVLSKTRKLALGIACLAIAVSLITAILIVTGRTSTVIDSLSSSPIVQRVLEGDTSYSRRVAAIETTIEAYTEKPILGWGPENYLVPWGRYLDEVADEIPPFDTAHNKIVEELITKGTIGLLSYLMIWLAIIFVLAHSIRYGAGNNRPLVIVISAALVALFVQNNLIPDTLTTTIQLSLLMAFVVSEEGNHSRLRSKADDGVITNKPRNLAHTRLTRAWITVIIIVSTVWSLYNFNLRPYQAAQASLKMLDASIWDDIAANFNESVNKSPVFANETRMYLIDYTSTGIAYLSPENYTAALNLVAREGQEALKVEPQNWLLQISLAQFYQQASHRNIEHLKLAEVYVQNAIELAPNASETRKVKELQKQLEQSIP